MNDPNTFIGQDFGWGELDLESARYRSTWRPASGHKSGWRVVRGIAPLKEHESRNGRLITFKSMESAQRRADFLNEEQITNQKQNANI